MVRERDDFEENEHLILPVLIPKPVVKNRKLSPISVGFLERNQQ